MIEILDAVDIETIRKGLIYQIPIGTEAIIRLCDISSPEPVEILAFVRDKDE